jgi:hypothetical protein
LKEQEEDRLEEEAREQVKEEARGQEREEAKEQEQEEAREQARFEPIENHEQYAKHEDKQYEDEQYFNQEATPISHINDDPITIEKKIKETKSVILEGERPGSPIVPALRK